MIMSKKSWSVRINVLRNYVLCMKERRKEKRSEERQIETVKDRGRKEKENREMEGGGEIRKRKG